MVRLGLTSDQFFRLTPRQLRVLADKDWERTEQQREHNELLAGIVAATVANYAGKIGKTNREATEFMPSYHRRKREKSKEQIADEIRFFLMAQMKLQQEKARKQQAPLDKSA